MENRSPSSGLLNNRTALTGVKQLLAISAKSCYFRKPSRTGAPGDDVVDADAEDGGEPEQDDRREEDAQPAGAQALEGVQRHQHRAA